MKNFVKILTAGIIAALICCCFANIALADDAYVPSDWAEYEVSAAGAVGILPAGVNAKSFTDNITREEFCEIIVRTYEKISGKEIALPKSGPFKDTTNPYILKASAQGIVDGFEDGTFRPNALLTRQEAAKMIQGAVFAEVQAPYYFYGKNSLYFNDSEDVADWAVLPIYILGSKRIMAGNEHYEVLPLANLSRQEAILLAVRSLGSIDSDMLDSAGYYIAEAPYSGVDDTAMFRLDSSLYLGSNTADLENYSFLCKFYAEDGTLLHEATVYPNEYGEARLTIGDYKTVWTEEDGAQMYDAENALFGTLYGEGSGSKTIYMTAAQVSPRGNVSPNAVHVQFSLTPYINTNDMLTGDFKRGTFNSDAEARAFMTTVTVPVWNIDKNGNKYASTRSFSVHRAFASDMQSAFQEIFDDPEQFPIKDIGGYDWRGGGRTEHNLGTAIDINANENAFYNSAGVLQAGSFFLPGENPYSIPLEGSVVRILAKYGWSRGFWNSGTDYMHFSYFGT